MSQLDATDQARRGALNADVFLIPDHELLRRIGSGAYGEVWLGRNSLGTLRAAKIVRRAEFDDARPFEREFAGINKFEPISRSHEGFVDLLHVGRNDARGYFYYVMELADPAQPALDESTSTLRQRATRDPLSWIAEYCPKTLAAEVKARGPLPLDDCLRITGALTSALAELHRHGLVHRDIKPSNIIFVDGVPKLADIGLVASANEARSFVGTEGFIPPEGPGTPQADLYSLGIVLYVISTGNSHRDFPEPPAGLASRPDRERWLEVQAMIHRACQADPRQRYASAEDMQRDVELLACGNSVRKKHRRTQQWALSRQIGLWTAIIALLIIMGVVLPRSDSFQEVKSRDPRVNKLVAEGYECVYSSTPERLRQGLSYFQQAISLEPDFVPAHAGIHGINVALGNLDDVRLSAKKLLDLDAKSAEAQVALAYKLWIDWRFQEALVTARHATQVRAYTRRAKARAHLAYGFQLLQTGQPQAALAEYRLAEKVAAELGVSDPTLEHHLGHPYLAQRNFKKALEHYARSVELEPRHWHGYNWQAAAYEEMGDFQNAIDQSEARDVVMGKDAAVTKRLYDGLREAAKGGPKSYWEKRLDLALNASEPDLYHIATVYAHLKNWDRAYDYLRRACEQRSFTQNLMFDLCWDHNDKEFIKIAKGIGIIL